MAMDYLGSLAGTFGDAEPDENAVEYGGEDGEACHACGFLNEPNQLVCLRCHSRVRVDEEGEDDEQIGELVMVPDFYQPLFQACHQVASGQIDANAWATVWNRLIQTFETIGQNVHKQLGQLREPSEEVQAAAADLSQHFEAALAALDSMGDYLDNPDPQILNQGWMRLMAATAGIQKASRQFQEIHAETLAQEKG